MGAFCKIAELEGTDRDADEAEDFDAEGVEHAADVAVFAFVEGELKPGVPFAGAEEAGALTAKNLVAFCFDSALEVFDE